MHPARLSRILFLVILVLVGVLLLVPNSALNFLRAEYGWLGSMANGIDRVHAGTGIDLDHAIVFAALGAAAGAAFWERRWPVLVAGLAVLAVASEIAQFWIPGRTPLVSDAMIDLGGAVAGLALARLALEAARRTRGRRQAHGKRIR